MTIDELKLPASNRGYLPTLNLGSSMLESPPETIGWGLLAAAASNDVPLVVSVLKELIYQARTRRWILRVEDQTVVNPDPVWGFEDFPIALAPNQNPFLEKDVRANAWLGLCICLTIKSLQDTYPIGRVKLFGQNELFREELLATLKAFANFAAGAISPQTGLAAGRVELGDYSYQDPSTAASYAVDLFLGHYLSLDYDREIHYKALGLRQRLLDNQVFAPSQNDSLPNLWAAALSIWWSLQYAPNQSSVAFQYFQSLVGGSVETDHLVAWLYEFTEETAPSWVGSLVQADEAENINTTEPLSVLAGAVIKAAGFSIALDSVFDLQSEAVSTLVAKAAQEVRRMWPFGSNWAGDSVEEETCSILGTLVNATAATYKPWYLDYLLLRAGIAPSTAVGQELRIWLDLIAPQKLIASDAFIRRIIVGVMSSKGNLEELLTTWGYGFEVTTPTPRPYSRLIDPYGPDRFDNYAPGQVFDPTAGLDGYLGLAYHPSRGLRVSADISVAEPISVNYSVGPQRRKVPGFAYRDSVLVDADIESSDDIPASNDALLNDRPRIVFADYTPTNPKVYVVDGPVVIDPLVNYLPARYVTLDAELVDSLVSTLAQTQPAGVELKLSISRDLT